MTCILYDVKKFGYDDVAIADYMNALGATPALQEMLIDKTVAIDTVGELATWNTLNSTREVDEKNKTVRQKGTIKITRNLDSNLLANHSDIVNAGLGEVIGATGTVTVTAGKGSVGTPFLTTSTSSLTLGQLIYIPNFGLRIIASIVANTSFTVDKPISTAISTSTTLAVKKSVKLGRPRGTCSKAFNLVVQDANGDYVVAMGACPVFEFGLSFEKQLTVTITFQCPEMYRAAAGSFTPTWTDETEAEPVICNFSESYFVKSDNTVQEYWLQGIDLGYSVTSKENVYNGGRNNVRGYTNRASIKPKLTFDKDTNGKLISSSLLRTGLQWSFYKSDLGLYIQESKGHSVQESINKDDHDCFEMMIDVNTEATKTVYLMLP